MFLKEFLLTILRIATVFPSLDSYFLDSGQAPIYQIYIRLLEHKVSFPKWEGEDNYELKILKHFRQRKEQNDMFLEELDKQNNGKKTKINPLRPTLEHIENYCIRNKENL